MVLCALALVLLQGTVSFEADAVRTDALVADLARQTGRQLLCDAVVASEPVIAQFKDQPLDDVLTHLADVVGGEWVVKGEVWRLTRSSSLRHTQELEEAKRMATALLQLVQTARKAVDQLRPVDEREAELLVDRYRLAQMSPVDMDVEVQRMFRTNPVARATTRILASMTVSDLAAVRVGGRLVFSDKPTPMQSPLPAKAGLALEELKRDAQLMLAANERLGQQLRPSISYGGLPDVGPGPQDSGYGKTIIEVRRPSIVRFKVNVTMVGRDGRNWLRGSGSLPNDYAPPPAVAYSHEGPKLALSDTAKAFGYMRTDVGARMAQWASRVLPDRSTITGGYGVTSAEQDGKAPDLGLGEVLSDPVGRDPLGIVLGASLRQVASGRGKQLLASVSDSTMVDSCGWILGSWVLGSSVQTQGDLMDALTQVRHPANERLPRVEVSETGPWMVVTPYLKVLAREQRMNRSALKSLQDAVRAQGAVRIADAARYLEKAPAPPSFFSLDSLYLNHFEPRIDPSAFELLRSPALPFVARLSPQTLRSLEAGVFVRDLTPDLRESVRRWVFDVPESSGDLSMREMELQKPLATETTEVFPNGIPAGAQVFIERSDAPAVIARAESGFRFFMSIDSLGFFEADSAQKAADGNPLARKLVGYRPASQATYWVRVVLPGGKDLKFGLTETLALPGSQEGKREELPKSALDRIEFARKAFAGG